jgi:hypothetical protein
MKILNGFLYLMAQRHNGAMAQTTFAKAKVVKGHSGSTAQWHKGTKEEVGLTLKYRKLRTD